MWSTRYVGFEAGDCGGGGGGVVDRALMRNGGDQDVNDDERDQLGEALCSPKDAIHLWYGSGRERDQIHAHVMQGLLATGQRCDSTISSGANVIIPQQGYMSILGH